MKEMLAQNDKIVFLKVFSILYLAEINPLPIFVSLAFLIFLCSLNSFFFILSFFPYWQSV